MRKNETSSRNASIAGHENIERHEQLSVNSLFNRVTYSSNVTSDTTTEGFAQQISVFIYGLFHAAFFLHRNKPIVEYFNTGIDTSK